MTSNKGRTLGPHKRREALPKPTHRVGVRVAYQMKAEPALCGVGVVTKTSWLPNRRVWRYEVECKTANGLVVHTFDEHEVAKLTDKGFTDTRQMRLDL